MRDQFVSVLRAMPLLAVGLQGPVMAAAADGGPMMTVCRPDGTRERVPFPLDDGGDPAPGQELHACHLMLRPDRDGRSQLKAPA